MLDRRLQIWQWAADTVESSKAGQAQQQAR
jgi:hypothetical protein